MMTNPDSIPRVTKDCVREQHRCMTCYEREKYMKKRGMPRSLREQMLRLMKVKPFSVQELSDVFQVSPEVILSTMSELKKAGLIGIADEEAKV
jgi:hypothetical protein